MLGRVALALGACALLLLAMGVGDMERVVLTGDLYAAGHSRPHPELCPRQGALLRVLILVSSGPGHKKRRNAIRYTWGNFAFRSDVAVAFVIGAPSPALHPALDAEDQLYGDIIVGNSVDTYSNLTLKTLSMLEWAGTHCAHAPWLLKTDDDVFVNVPHLLEFVSEPERAVASRAVWGEVCHHRHKTREIGHKCYLSTRFPGGMLPDYAAGDAYLLTADSIRPLLEAAPAEPYVHREDVFVTGMLANRVGISRQHMSKFTNPMLPHPCAVRRTVVVRNVSYPSQFHLWKELMYPHKCKTTSRTLGFEPRQ